MMKSKILAAILSIVMILSLFGCQEPPVTKSFTVTFDAQGGTAVSAQTVTDGEKATAPADPTKEDYNFLGWYVGDTKYDFNTAVTADVTLTAKWEKKPACNPEPENPNPENPNPENPNPENPNPENPNPENPNPEVTEFTVTFDSQGGSAVVAQTVQKDATATKPEDPTKTDFYFIGWYVGDTEYNFETPVTAAITLTAKWGYQPKWADLVGTWGTVIDVEGTVANYYLCYAPDGSAYVALSMDAFGTVIPMESAEIVLNTILMTIPGGGEGATETFVYTDDGKIYNATEDIYFERVNLSELLTGEWAGSEDYEGVQIPYTVSIAEDGTVTASLDMFGSVTPLTVKEFGNVLVLNYMNAMDITLVYNGEALIGTGIMGGALSIAPSLGVGEDMTLETIVGTWKASETLYDMTFDYTFVINADGSGTAKYSVGGFMDMNLIIESYTVVNNQLKIVYTEEGIESEPVTLTFILVDGTLVGFGPMGTELTMTPALPAMDQVTLEELAGDWSGTEITTDYGNYLYELTINADGTGTGMYVDEAGLYPTDMEITAIEIDGNTVKVTYIVYEMEYAMTFTYSNGVLTTAQGAVWGALTLTKGGAGTTNPDPVVPEATVTPADLAGIWTGSEATSFGDYLYMVTLNADGTGEGTYQDADGMYSKMYLENIVVTIDGTTVTFTYISYNTEYTIVFTYENGTLSSEQGAMWGSLTLTKN